MGSVVASLASVEAPEFAGCGPCTHALAVVVGAEPVLAGVDGPWSRPAAFPFAGVLSVRFLTVSGLGGYPAALAGGSEPAGWTVVEVEVLFPR